MFYIVRAMKRRKFVQNISASMLLLMSNGMVTPAKAADIHKKSLLRFAVTSDGHYGEKNTAFEEYFSEWIPFKNLQISIFTSKMRLWNKCCASYIILM